MFHNQFWRKWTCLTHTFPIFKIDFLVLLEIVKFKYTYFLQDLLIPWFIIIAGFQCHAIQNRSKQKSKPFNK